jgi:signal transduction histidine kinase
MSELERQVCSLHQGQHICLLYDNAEDQIAAIVPYIREGLRLGEFCMYVADDRTVGEVREALATSGIDVAAEVERGALLFLTKDDSYFRDGRFEPAATIEFLKESVSDAISQNWTGVRMAGEMTWALDGETSHQELIEYEAMLNEFFPGSRAVGLCQYNRSRFPPEIIYDVLCTHPVAVIGSQVCPNHFYEPPALVLDQGGKADRVEWRIAQLLRARATEMALEEANRVKTDFLAAMSHDLRTPLNAILGYSQILRDGVSGDLAPEQQKQLARIESNTQNLMEMIDELLSFSKMEAGQEEVEAERVTLTRIAHEAAAVVRQSAEAKGLEFRVEVPSHRVILWTDKGKVCKILLNLLSNAIKYTPRGNIELAARIESNGDDYAVFEVRDTGKGIDPLHAEMIFEPFWRVKGEKEQGTGLGLSVSRRLARLLGGDLTMQSGPGSGSVFTARLPTNWRALPRS